MTSLTLFVRPCIMSNIVMNLILYEMKTVTITRSDRDGKKWKAVFSDGGTIHFGAEGYQDYTQHKDPNRKKNYLSRHRKDPHNIKSAGELSR